MKFARCYCAWLTALVLASTLGTAAPAQETGLTLGGADSAREIRMHSPAFQIEDPRERELDDESGLDRLLSGSPVFSEEPAYATDTFMPIPGYLPLVDKVERSRKKRNWILPPTPDGLFSDSDSDTEEDETEESGDLLSSTKAIYERAYMGQGRREEEARAEEKGAQDAGTTRGTLGRAEEDGGALGLLLPESGLAMGPAVGLLGLESASQPGLGIREAGTLDSVVLEGLFAVADAALPGADMDKADAEFNPEAALALRGVAAPTEGTGSFGYGSGLSVSQGLLSGLPSGDGDGEPGQRASFEFSPTAVQTDGLGNWRAALSSTAAAMRPPGEESASSFSMSSFGESSRTGFDTGSAFDRSPELFSPSSAFPTGDGLQGSLPSDTSRGTFGSLPGLPRSATGAGSIGGFGSRATLSPGSSAWTSPSIGGRSMPSLGSFGSASSPGSGMRSGVRTVEEIPNPLGGSLFD